MKLCFTVLISLVITRFSSLSGSLAAEGDVGGGKALDVKHGEVCHGPEGKGDGYRLFEPPVADLISPAVQKKPDVVLWRNVHEGVSQTAMGTWTRVLSDEAAAHVLASVRS